MDISLKADVVEKAAEMSYKKSGSTFRSIISPTSVMNAIRDVDKIDNCYLKSEIAGKKVPILYVEADEDHVATQRSGGQIVKIAYVHEGRKEVGKGRHELINPRYFTALQGTSEDFWLNVTNYICEAYDTESLSKIYLSGDGARWIKEGLNWIPKSEFVLDTFHLAKYINKATAHALYTRNYLWEYIWSDMKYDVISLLKCNIDNADSEAKKKEVMEAKTYILNHWEAIQNIKNREYLNFILEQLSEISDITFRAMMGEYIIYYRGKIIGGIYDDRLLVKPVKSAVVYEKRYIRTAV